MAFSIMRRMGTMRPKRNDLKILPHIVVILICVSVLSFLTGCGTEGGTENENIRFEKYTNDFFCQEVSSSTISLHYTLKEPEKYGISEGKATFGNVVYNSDELKAASENMQRVLLSFAYDELDVQNKIIYDILNYSLKMINRQADYILYEEPLGLVSGVQTQIPVVLSEYQFYDREDVEQYLALLETTEDYFDQIMQFEKQKVKAGLFMADYMLDSVIEQCRAFLDMGDGNYLYSTFAERVQDVEGLTEKEKSDYIQKNALAIRDYIVPAYENMIAGLENLRGEGENEKGLSYFPEGKAYYELLAEHSTGSNRSVEEMEDMTRRQMSDDLEAMEKVLGITAEQARETAAGTGQKSAELILDYLEKEMKETFPEMPGTKLDIKYVPEAMEEHLSPAFYMIPAIDNTGQNVIYINQSQIEDDLTLFTTLAHEGYPGHLYQTVYFESTDPAPVRSIFNFGGYTEGWATYAEMGSYYLAPIPKEQAIILQKNASVILGIYALADIGIHYEGWSRIDTISFFKNYGVTEAETAEQIYELIIGSPANYLKYYIGYVEFLELKKKWIKENGEEYSQKDFHQAVLDVGPAAFDIVEEYMCKIPTQ